MRKVPPDGEQRLLRRVLGEAGVAQDPVRQAVEPVARGNGEAREGLLVTPLRPPDQVDIHTCIRREAPGGSGHSPVMTVAQADSAQGSCR
jgi:hypothetical protein